MRFLKPTRGKLLILIIGALSLRFAVFSLWKPYFGSSQTCMWKSSCLHEDSPRKLRSNLFHPGIQIAYIWKTILLYPIELLDLGKIGITTFKNNPDNTFKSFYAVSDHIISLEQQRNFSNTYTWGHIILLILYRYFLICILGFMFRYWRIIFFIPIGISLIVTIYVLLFFKSYFSDLILSFLPYLLIGNIITFFILLVLIWPWLKKSRSISSLLLRITLGAPIIFACVFGIQYYNFYTPNLVNISAKQTKTTIKFFSANMYIYNNQLEDLEQLIIKEDPDVISLIEYENSISTELAKFLNTFYPYHSERIFSRYPIDIIKNGTKYSIVHINKDQQQYNLHVIHTIAPMGQNYFERRNKELQWLAEEIEKKITQEHLIIAGDFNVSPRSYYFRILTKTLDPQLINLTRINYGIFTRRDPRIPFIASHIDHIWISKDMRIISFRKVTIPGSDHDGFIFELE